MPPSSISFVDRCPRCEQTVTATTKLGCENLMKALEQGEEVIAVHLSLGAKGGDHEWPLTKEQKSNLRKKMANGLV
jgi:hypothetical protein